MQQDPYYSSPRYFGSTIRMWSSKSLNGAIKAPPVRWLLRPSTFIVSYTMYESLFITSPQAAHDTFVFRQFYCFWGLKKLPIIRENKDFTRLLRSRDIFFAVLFVIRWRNWFCLVGFFGANCRCKELHWIKVTFLGNVFNEKFIIFLIFSPSRLNFRFTRKTPVHARSLQLDYRHSNAGQEPFSSILLIRPCPWVLTVDTRP